MRFNHNFGTDDNRMLGLPSMAGGMTKGYKEDHGHTGSALMLNNGMNADSMSAYNTSHLRSI